MQYLENSPMDPPELTIIPLTIPEENHFQNPFSQLEQLPTELLPGSVQLGRYRLGVNVLTLVCAIILVIVVTAIPSLPTNPEPMKDEQFIAANISSPQRLEMDTMTIYGTARVEDTLVSNEISQK